MSVKYKSTRGTQRNLSFEEVVLGGLAKDKGLYIPETIPQFSISEILNMRNMSYDELAYVVISKYVGDEDIPPHILKNILRKSFSTFRSKDVTPSQKLNDFWVLELFHGPTFAFKDVALQFLGNLFEYFLSNGKIQDRLTILGATSGDTGSAAIYGLRGKKNVNCFIMYPEGKVSAIQERQMTTILDENVDCIAIEGDFDDAQSIVKAAFADETFRSEVKLGAINSINWARVLAQITYYFYSWLHITNGTQINGEYQKLDYVVPTGNFGDILAGYYAKKMGLPIDKLVVSTNENDVLHRFLQTGCYSKRNSILTISPSMDISVSSNFERYLYYLANDDSTVLASWMNTFEATGTLEVPKKLLQTARCDFQSYSCHKTEIVQIMRDLYKSENYLVCPHTATAVGAIKHFKMEPKYTVCLATAHPAKFVDAVNMALSDIVAPPPPTELENLFSLPMKKTCLPTSLPAIQSFINKKINQRKRNFFSVSVLSIAVAVVAVGLFVVIRKR